MNTLYNTLEYKGFTIKIHYDYDARSPREEFDNLGTLYTAHRSYQPEEDFYRHFETEEVFDDQFEVFTKLFLKKYISLPVYLYDHSGLSVNTTGFSCRWDTSQFGIIAVSIADIKAEYGWKNLTTKRRRQIETYLDGEIETYNDYLTGRVFGFTIENSCGEEIDSCWGYYGESSISDIERECKHSIDCTLKLRKERRSSSIIIPENNTSPQTHK